MNWLKFFVKYKDRLIEIYWGPLPGRLSCTLKLIYKNMYARSFSIFNLINLYVRIFDHNHMPLFRINNRSSLCVPHDHLLASCSLLFLFTPIHFVSSKQNNKTQTNLYFLATPFFPKLTISYRFDFSFT